MTRPIFIRDFHDPRVDVYRNVRDADLRGRDRLFMAESELVVRRLLATPQRLHSIFLSPGKFERLREVIEAAQPTCDIYLADVDLMSAIAGFHIHRGALAAGYRPRPEELSLDRMLGHLQSRDHFTMLLAEGVTNVDNMGGLFRSAAAFGVDGIVLDANCCDPLYRKAIRVSVGHVLSVPYAVVADGEKWGEVLRRLKRPILDRGGWGMTLSGAENDARAVPLWRLPPVPRLGVLVGSEAHGLTEASRAICDVMVRIPMAGDVPSLNVATAAAIVLYERARGRADSAESAE